MRFRLTRSVSFRAHHRLADPHASAEENRRRFGSTVEPHAHHYRCEVSVSRSIGDEEAAVMDLPLLDRIIAEEVTGPFEGRHLHRDVPAFAMVPPTCEAMAREVYRRVAPRLPANVRLDRVGIAEDDSLRAEIIADA